MKKKLWFYLKKFDFFLLFLVFLLSATSFLTIWSFSFKEKFLLLKKQILFFVLGIFLFFIFSFFNWQIFNENPHLILIIYFLSLLSLVFLYFCEPVRGVHSWYKIGGITFNPAEFLKIILIILLAKYFSQKHIEMYRLRHIFQSGFYVLIPAILIFFQPDLGQVIILILLWLSILIISGIKIRQFLILMILFLIIASICWMTVLKDYHKKRILGFIFPDPLGVSWSQNQSKIAIGSGGFFGKGIGKGSQTQLGFLILPQTDFIFSAIAEQTGFLGVSILLLIFSLLIWQIMKVAFFAKKNFPKLFAGGLASLLFWEFFIHVAMNLGLIPVIGIPFPFVSYGGSNLIANFIALGILQNIKLNS